VNFELPRLTVWRCEEACVAMRTSVDLFGRWILTTEWRRLPRLRYSRGKGTVRLVCVTQQQANIEYTRYCAARARAGYLVVEIENAH